MSFIFVAEIQSSIESIQNDFPLILKRIEILMSIIGFWFQFYSVFYYIFTLNPPVACLPTLFFIYFTQMHLRKCDRVMECIFFGFSRIYLLFLFR